MKLSFDYGNFEIARQSIESGASLQEVLLLCDDTGVEKIGSRIFEMHKSGRHETDVISFFCSQLIGSKQILKVQ